MILEKLKKEHYFQPIFEILEELSSVGNSVKFSEFEEWIETLPSNHHIYILENDQREIVGMGTLFIEYKIIHSFGKVGHIEDIVISKNFRGKGYGKFLIKNLMKIAKDDFKVYKVILNSSDKNIHFRKLWSLQKRESNGKIFSNEN